MTLQKTWVGAKLSDAVTVAATGLTSLNAVANTASETDAGSAQTVRAGDVLTLSETFTTGSAANYTTTLACTGTTGLSGSTLGRDMFLGARIRTVNDRITIAVDVDALTAYLRALKR